MQAGQCGRCRGELGVAGRVCQHCRLDEQFVGWEVRIYSLQTHAMAAGQAVTAEEAIIRVIPATSCPLCNCVYIYIHTHVLCHFVKSQSMTMWSIISTIYVGKVVYFSFGK